MEHLLSGDADASPRQLLELHIPDEAGAWGGAGFSVSHAPNGSPFVSFGRTEVHLGSAGVWWVFGECRTDPPPTVDHANGVSCLDHVVVATPDVGRTSGSFADAGFPIRRTRATELAGTPSLQSFCWAGDVIIEIVGPTEPSGDGPARIWGLALVADDLDATVAWLGPQRCSRPRDAVQRGRRIAAIRTREVGVSVTLALMSPHPDS